MPKQITFIIFDGIVQEELRNTSGTVAQIEVLIELSLGVLTTGIELFVEGKICGDIVVAESGTLGMRVFVVEKIDNPGMHDASTEDMFSGHRKYKPLAVLPSSSGLLREGACKKQVDLVKKA